MRYSRRPFVGAKLKWRGHFRVEEKTGLERSRSTFVTMQLDNSWDSCMSCDEGGGPRAAKYSVTVEGSVMRGQRLVKGEHRRHSRRDGIQRI